MANESAYLTELGDKAQMRVEFTSVRGRIQGFVVQLESWNGERWLTAIRYDTSHGRGHKDTLNRAGRQIAKEWLPVEWTYNEALTYAIKDIRARWREYQRLFWGDNMANTITRKPPPEPTAAEIEQVNKNLDLLLEFWLEGTNAVEPPNGCNLILLPDDDPVQTAANIELGLRAIERGDNVYFRHVHRKTE